MGDCRETGEPGGSPLRWATGGLVLRFGRRAFGFGIRSVLDFLVEDACVLCRRGAGAEAVAPPGGDARHLLRPVSCHWFCGIHVTNHPICPRCATGFIETRAAGILGQVKGLATVTTPAGDVFGSGKEGGLPSESPRSIPIISPFMTNDNALELIRLIKFSGYAALIPPAADTICAALSRTTEPVPADAVLVAVPMTAREIRRRGFNQALRLAEAMGGRLGIPVAADAVRKITHTARQSQTRPERRADNVRDAFVCSGSATLGRRVILVDDLVTTGATAAACASRILGAGAADLLVACFARAL